MLVEKIECERKDSYSMQTKGYYNRLEWSLEDIEYMKELGKDIKEEAEERDTDIENQVREGKINES